jgi:hypothetical protein
LQVQIQRADTEQFLNSSGGWQTDSTTALTVNDATLSDAGLVGLNRVGSYTGRVTFDDFQVTLQTVVEPFEDTATGSLPVDWEQWGSAGGTPFQVSTTRPLAGEAGLESTASTSQATSRTWTTALQLADAQVTAALSLTSLAPGGILLRGINLDSTTPSYYALRATRGLEVELVLVDNGVATRLAGVTSSSYFSGPWVRLTLEAKDSDLRGQMLRTDTGEYLNTNGQWQSEPTWAINITDVTLESAGHAGLERPARYAGTLFWDDFSLLPASGDSQAPTVVITEPTSQSSLTGVLQVQVDAVDNIGVSKVEFYLDDVLQNVTTSSPYRWEFDTSMASNGSHTLTVLAYDLTGNVGRKTLDITTQNDTSVSRPDIPRHYSHIRIAMLAYNGTPFGTTEDKLLRDSVDLVITSSSNLSKLNSKAPNTPRMLYSNVSNLYLDSLTDWLAYSDSKGYNRESAFYHASRATAFTGSSPSSQPVNWFWSVQRDGSTWTNYTSQARGTTTSGVALGAVGTSLYLGFPDRFRELNVTVQTAASGGWTGVWEYPTAVNSSGQPTAWATLNTLSNTTAGLSRNGQILFDPPSNWKSASINGSARMFFVRQRTTRAGTAPVLKSVLGSDYVNARGTTRGTIPAFDSLADTNHDGYLNDTEYARRASGKDARFSYQSRMFHGSYGQMRFTAHPSSLSFRDWAADYHNRLLSAQPLGSGLFMDNSDGTLPFASGTVIEATASYANDLAATLNTVARKIAPKWILANTVGGGSTADTIVRRIQGYYEEFAIRPLAHNYRQFEDLAATVSRRSALRSPAPYAIIDSYPTGGSPTDSRTQLATLAYYYLLADPVSTFLNFYGGHEPSTTWSRHWSPAAAYNIGQPQDDWSQFATGSDPSNSALTYRVYQRSYDNALVLYKPLSANSSTNGSLSGATTHSLNGSYRVLKADGTLGSTVTSITLRNGEGAILIKTSS